MIFKIIDSLDDFYSLKVEWNSLAARSQVDHAFMRHEWFTAWLGHLGRDGELRILTGWGNGSLVAAAPFQLQRVLRRGISFNALTFLMSAISPRCHFLLDPDVDPGEFYSGIFDIPGWTLAELKSMEAGIPETEEFIEFVGRRAELVVENGAVSPYEVLPEDWGSFEKSRSKGFRKRFRNSLNRCGKSESFRIVKLETFAELDAHFEDLLDVSRNSWKAEGGTDLATQSGMGDFFREFSRLSDEKGLWVVYLLFLEGRPAAFDYYLKHRNRLVGLRWEYDENFKYYMPGVVTHVQAIKDLISEGDGGEFDLSGTETVFKSGLVKTARRHLDVTFGNPGIRSHLLMGMKRVLTHIHDNAAPR